jgi:hypothetical protein
MKPTVVKNRTQCPKGHDLRIHGYYFGTNQRCRACNRTGDRGESCGLKNPISEENPRLPISFWALAETGCSIGSFAVLQLPKRPLLHFRSAIP